MPQGNAPGVPDPIVVQLSDRRRQLGMSARMLSLQVGFPETQISMYESGARVPGVPHLRRWAFGLGLRLTLEEF